MKFGFAFRRLALIGPGKVPAEVTFMRGLNVIGGPSDSGKSFIAQCIDYALGGGAAPRAHSAAGHPAAGPSTPAVPAAAQPEAGRPAAVQAAPALAHAALLPAPAKKKKRSAGC